MNKLDNIESLYNLYLKFPSISTDSRIITKNSLFFALKGDNFNGNNFAVKALEDGAEYAIVDENINYQNERILFVDNVLKTLQDLATYHRQKLNIPIIGITGTNGKTTTKELIFNVLSSKYNTLATKGNLNNHIGVPLTIMSINQSHEIAVIEMGANHPNEIEFLCNIAQPNYGIITNIGKAHLEGFGGFQGVIKTKNELYNYIKSTKGHLFVNQDNNLLYNLSQNSNIIFYSEKNSDSSINGFIDTSKNAFITVNWKNNNSNKNNLINTKLIGNYNLENILAAICIGNYFKIDDDKINNAIEKYCPSNSRSQLINTQNNTIILDAYNANPTSMEASIINFSNLTFNDKITIIGDMLELGSESIEEHLRIYNLIKKLNFKENIFVGNIFNKIINNIDEKVFINYEEANMWIKTQNYINCTFLIKGSRGIKLEKIVENL